MRKFILFVAALAAAGCSRPAPDQTPNVVLIFVDDMGYGDIGPFGSSNRTPNLDRMAAEGLKLTQFYVSAVNCTPSRSTLMTGSYADRLGMDGPVVFPADPRGLHPDEITLAEMFKSRGYATACIGKWHLGDQPEFLATRQGFDEYFGLPYSNDMWTGHPTREMPPLPVLRGETPVAWISDGVDQALIAEAYDAEAVDFIQRRRDSPFFLYLPHSFVHLPRWVRAERLAAAGGDVNRATAEEIDDSVGRILDALRANGLAEKTLVLFTSDNGGAPSHGSNNHPLRGGKGSTFEGGMRVCTIAWWPGTIPAGTRTDAITSMMDVLPTLARLAEAALPTDRTLDGVDQWPVLAGTADADPRDHFHYFRGLRLEAVRSGPWKLHLALADGPKKGPPRARLFHLIDDIGESTDRAGEHPEVVQRLTAMAQAIDADLGVDGVGPGCRELGRIAAPRPLIDHDGSVRPDMAGDVNRFP
jgi:arylsulfatase A